MVDAQGGAQRLVQPTVAEELPTSAEGTRAVKVKKKKDKRGRSVKVAEDAVPESEQLSAEDLDVTNQDLDMTNAVSSMEREAEVSNGSDGSSTENHIPSRLLNTSVKQRSRRPYKAAGRLGLKVARGRSKKREIVEAGTSASASTGHGADRANTVPTLVSTETPAAAYPTYEPTVVPTSSLKRSARIQKRKERRVRFDEVGGVATDSIELETCCLADWSTHRQEVVYWSMKDAMLNSTFR